MSKKPIDGYWKDGLKWCPRCQQYLDVCCFGKDERKKSKLKPACKNCEKKRVRENKTARHAEVYRLYVLKNKDKLAKYHREWHQKNKERRAIAFHERYIAKKDAIREYTKAWQKANPEKIKQYRIKWEQNEHGKYKEYLKRKHKKQSSNPTKRISQTISSRIRRTINGKYGNSWKNLVGFDLNELKRHIEKQFTEGMNWENYGSFWNIDHIIPVSAFNFTNYDDVDFKKCWSLKNLRPLKCQDNYKKGKKLLHPFQPSLAGVY